MDTVTKLTNLLAILNEPAPATMPVTAPLPTGGVLSIVVADRGWVYIGRVEQEADWLTVIDARQITRWGTTKGLNEHDAPKWTSYALDAAPVPLEILMAELNKVGAREVNAWAVIYPQNVNIQP